MASTLPAGELFALDTLVTPTAQGIASRVLARTAAGNITLFAFDAGEGLSEHTTPHEALVQVLDGSVEITIGSNPVTLAAGQSIILPAAVPHTVKAVEKFKMMLTMIKS